MKNKKGNLFDTKNERRIEWTSSRNLIPDKIEQSIFDAGLCIDMLGSSFLLCLFQVEKKEK